MKKSESQSKEKARLRVFFAEFEGNDETIQEGLRSIAEAVNKTFDTRVQVIKQITKVDNPLSTADNDKQDLADNSDEVDLDFDEEVNDSHQTSDRKKQKRTTTSRKYPNLVIVKDLNLRPEGKQHLREFFNQKQPTAEQEVATLFLYYLLKVVTISNVNPNHIFTCYKDVEKKPPKDVPQVIRNAQNRKGWIDASDINNLKITNHGENFVEHDLPKKKS